MPGTEINVTPDIEVPIIAIATTNQGDCRLPMKKSLFPTDWRRVVKKLMPNKRQKYAKMIIVIIVTDIFSRKN